MNVETVMTVYFTLMNKRRKVTRSTLAERAGVNVRTVSRCIDALTLAGVPIYSETGPRGGYYIPDDYVVTSASFNDEEKARILNCVSAARPNFSDKVCDGVIDKVKSLSGGKDKFLINSDTLVIDASGWNSPRRTSAKISALGNAVQDRLTVSMKYVDRYESASERKFDPYCLVLKSGAWYVYGWCHSRRNFRLFKIARIKDIVISEDTFERLPSDVYGKLQGDFDGDETVQFEIEFDNLTMPEIEEWLGTDAIEDRGRCYAAHAETAGGNVLVSKIMSFGSSVKVISPDALREEVEIECKRMLSLYED